MSNPPNVRKRSPQSRLGVSGTAGAGTRRGMEAGAGLGVEVDRIARNASRGARAATGRGVYLDTVRVSGTVANNGTMDVDGLQPGHLYAIHINVHWEGTQTPHTYGTTTGGVAVPPMFYGEITFGSGAHVRDKRIVSYAGASSIDGYTVSGFYEAGEGLYVQARAFPPTFYPTTITCDLNFTAHHLRPL